MKFWLTIIVSIIATSAALTWLTMKVGGQSTFKDPYESSAAKPEGAQEKGKLVFVLSETQKQTANVVESKYGDCFIDKEHKAEFRYRNDGKGPLELVLRGLSCECLKEFSVDGKPVKIQEKLPAKPPGHEGTLKLVWRPTDKQLPPRAPPKEQRFTANLFTNDPALADVQLEVLVRLINTKE